MSTLYNVDVHSLSRQPHGEIILQGCLLQSNVYSDCYNATGFNEQHLLTQQEMERQKQTGGRKTKWIFKLVFTTVLKALKRLPLSTRTKLCLLTQLLTCHCMNTFWASHWDNSSTRDFNTFKFPLGWWFKLMWLRHSLDKFLDYDTIINACITRMQNLN